MRPTYLLAVVLGMGSWAAGKPSSGYTVIPKHSANGRQEWEVLCRKGVGDGIWSTLPTPTEADKFCAYWENEDWRKQVVSPAKPITRECPVDKVCI
jgi:hypothetical protein